MKVFGGHIKRHLRLLPITSAFLFFISVFLFTACPPEEPDEPRRDTTINLQVIKESITSVELQISVADTSDTWTFGLMRSIPETSNDSMVIIAEVYNTDTVVTDGGLSPGTEYGYRAYWLEHGIPVDSSYEVIALTMDTTSHNFGLWQIDTLGEYGSYLNDAAIIDENNIWAVGNIRTGEYPNFEYYGAAVWDGRNWNLKKLEGSGINTPSIAPRGIGYFSENDIWFASGSIYHWDGIETSLMWLRNINSNETLEKVWASSSSNIFFVGNEGTIVHYNGKTFTKINSGTDVRLIDVEGTQDGEYVFAAGYDFVLPTKTVALMIHNGSVKIMYYSDDLSPKDDEDYGAISGVSVWGDTAYFVTMQGLWKYNFLEDTSKMVNELDNYGYNPIKVQAPNDIFVIGGGFQYVHYNGSTWDYNNSLYEAYSFASYGGTMKNNMAVIVGMVKGGNHAIVARGYR